MPKSSPSPTPLPAGNVLPIDSSLIFVLDDSISSKSSKAGQTVRVHLKNAIVVGGRVVAPAGTPGLIKIVDSSPSDILDVYGFVDIYFEPLTLPSGRVLPLRAPIARLEPRVTSGHESTVAAEDTVGDIVVPYYAFYQIFRKGKNFVLGPGAEVPARTQATILAQPDGTIAIATPHPMQLREESPTSAFPVVPMATPIGGEPTPLHSHPLPSPSASPAPTPSPSSSPHS
jgi:hypothetical protein